MCTSKLLLHDANWRCKLAVSDKSLDVDGPLLFRWGAASFSSRADILCPESWHHEVQ